MKNLSLGLIGAGGIMRERHWPNLARLEGIDIACICNSTSESAWSFLSFAKRDAEVLDNWQDVITHPDVDVVWVAAPPLLHSKTVLAALKAKKPVFCQARMAMDLKDALLMREAHQASEITAAFCAAPFGMTVSPWVKDFLQSGELGRPVHLEFFHHSNSYFDSSAPAHWRQKREINGINFLTCGIFAEVLMDWFGPPIELRSIGRILHKQRGDYEVTLPDYVDVQARWENGMTGTLSWSGIHPNNERPLLRVHGEKSTLEIRFQPDEIFLSDSAKALEKITPPESLTSSWQVEENFIRAVRGENVKPGISFDEGVRYMAFTQAVLESYEAGGIISKMPTL